MTDNASANSAPSAANSALERAERWLEHAGFAPGQHVKVDVEHGRLTISAESERRAAFATPLH
ncbi:SymE family type I addiction module toxin [Caballeronia sp. 15715]|uniref:SymE family type I addiction module toxin n=1 Tax=Caballeronia sp. 15715 TaxID=3391030 RepID=UPI0039E5364C